MGPLQKMSCTNKSGRLVYLMLLVGGSSVLITGDVYFSNGRMGTGLPHDAPGWLGGELRARCLLHYGTQSSRLRSNGKHFD